MQRSTQRNTAQEEKAILIKDQEDLKAFQFQALIEENGTFMAPHTARVSPNVCEHDRAELPVKVTYDTLK